MLSFFSSQIQIVWVTTNYETNVTNHLILRHLNKIARSTFWSL